MQDEKRPAPRVGAEIVVRLAYATADEFIERHSHHVTRGGLFVRLAEPLTVGTGVAFQLMLVSGESALVGSGVVAWATAPMPHAAPGDLPGIGLSFASLDPRSRAIVDLIVATRGGDGSVDEPPRPVPGAAYAEIAPAHVSIAASPRPPTANAPGIVPPAPPRPKRSGSPRIVGIDLGTTNSCVAIAEAGGARVIASKLGYSTVPSVVALDDQGELLVGHRAKSQMVLRPTSTVYGSKRLVGRPFASPTVQACRDRFHYEIVEGEGGAAAVRISGRVLSLREVAAEILKELRQMASESLGEEIVRAAITVPAYYNDHQRQAVREAGQMAGLRVERIVNEPTAAAVAFGFGRSLAKRVLVYDLGGGTFDASVVEVEGDLYEVVSTGGDTFLGGVDFDNQLVDHLVFRFREEHGFMPPDDLTVWQRIVEAAEQTKVALSARDSATAHVPNLCASNDGKAVDLQVTVRRSELEALTRRLVDRTIEVCHEVLRARGLGKDDLDEVLLVGGQSRMPFVWRRIREEFGREPSKSVHPDEAVAIGAALLADADHRVDSVVLLDALAMSIGIGLPGGKMIPVLARNTRLPTRRTYEVVTTVDDQRDVELAVFQGDAAQVSQCEYLGTVRISDLPPGAKGSSRIGVEFALGNEGILSLRARDVVTGKSVPVQLATVDTPASLREKLQLPEAPVAPRGARPILSRVDGERGEAAPAPAPRHAAGNVSTLAEPAAPLPQAADEDENPSGRRGLLSRLFGRR